MNLSGIILHIFMIPDTFVLPTDRNLSLAAQFETSGFQPLNDCQEKGVKNALKKNFSLIQGPPGMYDNLLWFSSILLPQIKYGLEKRL